MCSLCLCWLKTMVFFSACVCSFQDFGKMQNEEGKQRCDRRTNCKGHTFKVCASTSKDSLSSATYKGCTSPVLGWHFFVWCPESSCSTTRLEGFLFHLINTEFWLLCVFLWCHESEYKSPQNTEQVRGLGEFMHCREMQKALSSCQTEHVWDTDMQWTTLVHIETRLVVVANSWKYICALLVLWTKLIFACLVSQVICTFTPQGTVMGNCTVHLADPKNLKAKDNCCTGCLCNLFDDENLSEICVTLTPKELQDPPYPALKISNTDATKCCKPNVRCLVSWQYRLRNSWCDLSPSEFSAQYIPRVNNEFLATTTLAVQTSSAPVARLGAQTTKYEHRANKLLNNGEITK